MRHAAAHDAPPATGPDWGHAPQVVCALAAALAATLLPGCKVGYVLKQAGGQIHVLQHRVPLATALDSPSVSASDKERISYIVAVKDWGSRRIGLQTGKNYTRFYDTHGKAVAYNLVACPKDSLEPVTWWFPILGSVPYLGYFDRADAVAGKKGLDRAGYDTCLRTVAAYSSLGWFEDPIFSPMLRYDDADLANLILHESVHATVYFNGRGAFNETFASFVAYHATEQFLAEALGPGASALETWRASAEDQKVFSAAMHVLQERLDALYKGPLTRGEKVQLRADVYAEWGSQFAEVRAHMRTHDYDNFPPSDMNNAVVASYLTYDTDTSTLEALLRSQGGDLRQLLEFYRGMPGGEDPLEYARKHLGGR